MTKTKRPLATGVSSRQAGGSLTPDFVAKAFLSSHDGAITPLSTVSDRKGYGMVTLSEAPGATCIIGSDA